jgi:hypothetical protein
VSILARVEAAQVEHLRVVVMVSEVVLVVLCDVDLHIDQRMECKPCELTSNTVHTCSPGNFIIIETVKHV